MTRGMRVGLILLLSAAAACETKQTPTQVVVLPSPSPSPVVLPSPSPSPQAACAAPPSCPPLYVWSLGVHHWMDGNAKLVDGPQIGGVVLMDSTPRFSSGRRSCNNEDHAVCESDCGEWRRCEDPRGARWSVDGPAHLVNVQQPGAPCDRGHDCGYQARVALDDAGLVEVTTCPPPNYVDAHGKEVEVIGSGCQTYTFRVPFPS